MHQVCQEHYCAHPPMPGRNDSVQADLESQLHARGCCDNAQSHACCADSARPQKHPQNHAIHSWEWLIASNEDLRASDIFLVVLKDLLEALTRVSGTWMPGRLLLLRSGLTWTWQLGAGVQTDVTQPARPGATAEEKTFRKDSPSHCGCWTNFSSAVRPDTMNGEQSRIGRLCCCCCCCKVKICDAARA